jgi:uncharacterized protein (TIGR02678 family)
VRTERHGPRTAPGSPSERADAPWSEGSRRSDAVEERCGALRALLDNAFISADEPAYALVRRHEAQLARTCMDLFGYGLEIGSTAARLVGTPTAAALQRALPVRPASASGRARPRDEWPTLSDRAAVLLLLILAALERGGTQTAIAELARDVARAGADAQPPVPVDFTARSERVAFADGLDLLTAWGVLEHTAGARASFSRIEPGGEDEALLTVDRRRLALVLRDPVTALDATSLTELLDDDAAYAPTPEGENRRRLHRLARRLVEDPAVVLDDLDEADRTYFLSQRQRLEERVAEATGLVVERRSEGTALIATDRRLSDVVFPTNATVKQVALLLCDVLTEHGGDVVISEEAVREHVRVLLLEHAEHWRHDPADPVQVTRLARDATAVLCALDLAREEVEGLRPRPLAWRFRSPELRVAGAAR